MTLFVRLRSGDISDLLMTFLTQSEAHLRSLHSEIESSEHLAAINASIDDDNASMLREIERFTRRNCNLKEQEEKQKAVLGKLRAIKREFAQRETADRERRREEAAHADEEQRRAEADTLARSLPRMRQQFKLSAQQEAFLCFVNECATSVRSVIRGVLNVEAAQLQVGTEWFEAPKLAAMITEIVKMTDRLQQAEPMTLAGTKQVLTLATAYFAFSALFDESEKFIASES
jgi:hypothetical protein